MTLDTELATEFDLPQIWQLARDSSENWTPKLGRSVWINVRKCKAAKSGLVAEYYIRQVF